VCGMTSRPSRERRPPSRPEPGGPANVPCVTSNGGRPAPPPAAAPAKEALRESWTFESPDPMFDDPGRCSVCDTDLEVDGDLLLQCDGCRAPVHASCYGARGPPDPDAPLLTGPDGLPLFPQPTLPRPDHPWRCDPCAILGAGAGARTACEACPIIGGALVRAADPPPGAKRVPGRKGGVGGLRWVHVACALWCPELGFAGLGETPQPRGGVVGGVRIPAPIALAPQTIVPALAPTLAPRPPPRPATFSRASWPFPRSPRTRSTQHRLTTPCFRTHAAGCARSHRTVARTESPRAGEALEQGPSAPKTTKTAAVAAMAAAAAMGTATRTSWQNW